MEEGEEPKVSSTSFRPTTVWFRPFALILSSYLTMASKLASGSGSSTPSSSPVANSTTRLYVGNLHFTVDECVQPFPFPPPFLRSCPPS